MPYRKPSLPNQLKALRKKRGWRQADVARRLGFEDEVRISAWENGSAAPGLPNLLKLCLLFGVSARDLYPDLYEELGQEVEARKRALFLQNGGDALS